MDEVAWLIRVQVLTGMLLEAIEAAPSGDGRIAEADREQLLASLRTVRATVDDHLGLLAPEAEAETTST